MTGALPRGPDFINVGAQKAASTWLYSCLREHPQIFMAPKNRVWFFQHPDYSPDKWGWYLSHFGGATANQRIGDSRVEYLYHPESAKLIARHLPRCKILVSLRDPVDRGFSALLWMQRRNLLPLEPPNSALARALADFGEDPTTVEQRRLRQVLEMGFYSEQLERYFDIFDRDRFLIFFTDDVRRRPLKTIRSVFRFLDVDSDFTPRSLHGTPLKAIGTPFLIQAERLSKGVPGAFRALQLVNRLLERAGFAKPPPDLDPGLRRQLKDFYAPRNRRLATLLAESRLDTEAASGGDRSWLTSPGT